MDRFRPLPAVVAALAALVLLAAGCGSSGDSTSPSKGAKEPTATAGTPAAPPGAAARTCEGVVSGADGLRVTRVGCDVGRRVVAAWVDGPGCSGPAGASRYSCSVYGYRCLGAATASGIAVSCSRNGSSVAFLAKRG